MVKFARIVDFYVLEVDEPLNFTNEPRLTNSVGALFWDACVGDITKTYRVGLSSTLSYETLYNSLEATLISGFKLSYVRNVGVQYWWRKLNGDVDTVTGVGTLTNMFYAYPNLFEMIYPLNDGWIPLAVSF